MHTTKYYFPTLTLIFFIIIQESLFYSLLMLVIIMLPLCLESILPNIFTKFSYQPQENLRFRGNLFKVIQLQVAHLD